MTRVIVRVIIITLEETVLKDVTTVPANEADVECVFDSGVDSDVYDYFKLLLSCHDIDDVSKVAFKLVQLLQLGKLGKGAVT